jgi:hypothetical protein
MQTNQLAPIRFTEDGGFFTDEQGNEHFIRGYGVGRHNPPDLDPRIDLCKPIWEQVQRLARKDQREEKKRSEAA